MAHSLTDFLHDFNRAPIGTTLVYAFAPAGDKEPLDQAKARQERDWPVRKWTRRRLAIRTAADLAWVISTATTLYSEVLVSRSTPAGLGAAELGQSRTPEGETAYLCTKLRDLRDGEIKTVGVMP